MQCQEGSLQSGPVELNRPSTLSLCRLQHMAAQLHCISCHMSSPTEALQL